MAMTPLKQLAAASKRGSLPHGFPKHSELSFPMYTVAVEVLVEMRKIRTHEELLEAGILTQFDETLGRALFVSHQWLANDHPDPLCQQFKVLQGALSNMISGRSSVRIPIPVELLYGRLKVPTSSDLKAKRLFIWYDYFSCPQGASNDSAACRQSAIDSIVSYVARCEYFTILCPELEHADQRQVLSQDTWAERGWCRTERLARELAVRDDGFVIVIESAAHQSMMSSIHRHLDAPGSGLFTLAGDRARVAPVVLQLVWKKLMYYLQQGDLHNFRFLLNTQDASCLMGLRIDPLEGIVPGFEPQADPFTDPQAFEVERFLHDNGFRSVSERDSKGWTPLCYAVLTGRQFLVTSLLEKRASCNEKIARHKGKLLLPKNMSVLALAAYFRRNEVMKVLLAARATVDAVDNHFSVPMHWAVASDNVEGLQILREAGANMKKTNLPGMDTFLIACFCGSLRAIQDMVGRPATPTSQGLHFALMGDGGGRRVISTLIQASADVNEQLIPEQPLAFRFISALLRLRHRVDPSKLTEFCYHGPGATPLILSVLGGSFAASYLLLEAGADPSIRNGRGKKASDFARGVNAPTALVDILEGRAATMSMLANSKAESDDEDFFEI